MAAPEGVVLRDLGTEPEPKKNTDDGVLSDNITEKPTESHAHAVEAPVVEGGNLVDDGWNKDDPSDIQRLVDGLSNEDFWCLVRRFNKQVFYIKETNKIPPSGLDLNLADDAEFSANKFRSQIERLYMGPLLGILAGVKHIARLRSWIEPRRTGAFCAVYFVAWCFNTLLAVFITTAMTLCISPKARNLLFPPAPMALTDMATGGLTKPRAGVLGATDAVTGAPENVKGESVENEASNFVTSLVGIAVNTLTAQDPKAEPENEKGESHPTDSMPQPNEATTLFAVAKDKAAGISEPSHDKTKYPMETIMWSKMLPLMRLVHFISDNWERIANVLDPTPPFPRETHRVRLAGLLSPMLAVSLLFSGAKIIKATTFIFGVIFFGDPLIRRTVGWLDRWHPGWTQLLRLEAHLLRGVPNDAQLAITLLRLGEAHGAPFPPAPSTDKSPPQEPLEFTPEDMDAAGDDAPLGATQDEIDQAKAADPDRLEQAGGPDSEIKDTGGPKTSRFLAFVKGSAKLGVKAALQADKLRAKAGRESAKNRLGAVPPEGASNQKEGPTEFSAHWDGKPGHVRISPGGFVSFDDDWSIRAADITELKKHSGIGVKSKLAIGWAMDRDVADGVEIKDRNGNTYVLSAVPLRDQLFNRLCAMGGQKWEVW
ncbi:hypothetical protein N657DRAFT_318464 [Parathielavia appendiculata]|uniref:Uncharacterized protein n=1 Tax=Parathielavia appendiculata TaxID=2587402 RepID=A0AAN6YYP9_9PEZI|nr:hypothetical protein N657DRAFT_318464 [Parathielavia appendiculata]